ncbi:uncharacterized protein EV420DRAFT_1571956 [Desarmillaria tabescens]|uniref:F-box domain-containing protein n=1 Tax=Armillaria tabescens TaxID=1929756 RepID=A0AA39JPJ6_ARMTA|nr:uncharacterized protein EV420DRAFT_1571956 [Desarmillaria tabescens]KAK0445635.1 hypothetical protein EV420DRAFT_1571956 [Desarmillaria tabescens]
MSAIRPRSLPELVGTLVNENFIHIFQQLDDPKDLFHVMQTCTRFRNLAIRELYKHIRYTDIISFNSNTPFWCGRDDNMHEIPTSVTLDRMLPLNFKVRPQSAYIRVWTRLLSFTSLDTLSFANCALPESESVCYLLGGMQNLRTLSFKHCIFVERPLPFCKGYGRFPGLPITDLTLLYNRTFHTVPPHDDQMFSPEGITPHLQFATAATLRSLTISWDNTVSSFFANYTREYSFSSTIDKVNIHFSDPLPDGGHPFLDIHEVTKQHLGKFLCDGCGGITELGLYGPTERYVAGDIDCGDFSYLERYTGPATLIGAITGPLQELVLSDLDLDVGKVTPALEVVAARSPNLIKLDITIAVWDMEVLYAVSQLFSDLRELRIKYHDGYPDEAAIVSMPSMFFHGFVNMTTLHIYNPQMPVGRYACDEGERWIHVPSLNLPGIQTVYELGPCALEDVLDLMMGWIKTCPKLTEMKWEKNRILMRTSTNSEDKWYFKVGPQPTTVIKSVSDPKIWYSRL